MKIQCKVVIFSSIFVLFSIGLLKAQEQPSQNKPASPLATIYFDGRDFAFQAKLVIDKVSDGAVVFGFKDLDDKQLGNYRAIPQNDLVLGSIGWSLIRGRGLEGLSYTVSSAGVVKDSKGRFVLRIPLDKWDEMTTEAFNIKFARKPFTEEEKKQVLADIDRELQRAVGNDCGPICVQIQMGSSGSSAVRYDIQQGIISRHEAVKTESGESHAISIDFFEGVDLRK